MSENKPSPWEFTRKGCLTIAIVFIGLFLAVGIYVFVQINNYMNNMKNGSINYYCEEAQIPSYASAVEKCELVRGFKVLESKKCKTEEKLIAELPYGFEGAVKYALTEGRIEGATDIDGKPVTRYYIPEDKIPLDRSSTYSGVERYYYVIKYPDNSYRFAIMVQITDPDI